MISGENRIFAVQIAELEIPIRPEEGIGIGHSTESNHATR
jgi:hypothetical protein